MKFTKVSNGYRRAVAIFVIVGPCFLVLAVGFAVRTEMFLRRSVATTGKVVDLIAEPDAENNTTTYAPVFQFLDAQGGGHTVASHNSSNPAEFTIGQTVPVRYDPAEPAGAKIDSFWQLWALSTVFGLVGLIFTVVGFSSLIYFKRRNRRSFHFAS